MALRNIVKEGDPILRKTSRTVLEVDDRIRQLLDDMIETMRHADGCGLAAVQVGILKRICVVELDDKVYEFINPVIIEKSGEQFEQEGCLSIPGVYDTTCRPMEVTVRAQDRNGETYTVSGSGLLARAFCHEIDHLDGILFTDRTKGTN